MIREVFWLLNITWAPAHLFLPSWRSFLQLQLTSALFHQLDRPLSRQATPLKNWTCVFSCKLMLTARAVPWHHIHLPSLLLIICDTQIYSSRAYSGAIHCFACYISNIKSLKDFEYINFPQVCENDPESNRLNFYMSPCQCAVIILQGPAVAAHIVKTTLCPQSLGSQLGLSLVLLQSRFCQAPTFCPHPEGCWSTTPSSRAFLNALKPLHSHLREVS